MFESERLTSTMACDFRQAQAQDEILKHPERESPQFSETVPGEEIRSIHAKGRDHSDPRVTLPKGTKSAAQTVQNNRFDATVSGAVVFGGQCGDDGG